MTRSRLALAAALCGALLTVAACGDDSVAVGLPDPTSATAVPDDSPATATAPRTSAPSASADAPTTTSGSAGVAETPVPFADADAPAASADVGIDDVLFMSNITEFTLMSRSADEQIELGRALCGSLDDGRSKSDVSAQYVDAGRYTRAEISNVLLAATVAYCPEYA